ncbi:AAA family ATPase [Mycolicibacterium fortuitum]|uniref:AAA family ATPase n=1 Tax=Mycolicibacterium fortuitum TaxID=1766 RepID=UPI000AC6496E|nr:AAA family ATPase [Mycolicibacterium fortuitum]
MTDPAEIITRYTENGWVPFAYASETTPPMRWQDTRLHDGTVRECVSALDEGYPVGIVLGQQSGIAVVDIDVQHGGTIEAFTEKYGKDQVVTYGVSTASGGYHLYYRYPEGIDRLPKRINAGKYIDGLGPGIDLLADGHHVIAPPTVRTDHPTKPAGKYRVLSGNYPVAPLPAALLADWLEAGSVRPEYQGDVVEQIPVDDHRWALSLHAANVRAAAESVVGERDTTVYKRLVSSVRLAWYLPDDVLTVAQVELDFVTAYEAAQGEEILDMAGKLRRAQEYAVQHPWVIASTEPTALPEGVSQDQAGEFLDRVSKRMLEKLVGREVERRLSELDAGELELPVMLSGDALVQAAAEDPDWAVDGLLAPGHSVLFSAQKKAGKTTTVLNLIHSLTTGIQFLGEYKPARPMRVLYLDMELGRGTATSYAAQLGIPLHMLEYVDLKGRAKDLDFRNDRIRAKWVRMLLERDVDAVVIDPVGPIVSALGINENDNGEIRRLLDSFDTLTREAGCLLGPIVVHHSGHNARGRARGATAFGDWPSVEWNQQRPTDENGAPVAGDRTFSIQSNRATGGTIHGPRTLAYEPATRRSWYGGNEKPLDPKRVRYEEFVGAATGEITVADVVSAAGITDKSAKTWLNADVDNGLLTVTAEGGRGVGNARRWQRRSPWYPAVV